jgi:general secretion pathway protein M
MRDWFEALQPRERIMVAGCTVVLIVAILYLGLWMPLDRGLKGAELRVDGLRLALAELRPLKGQTMQSAGSTTNAASTNQSLVVIIDSTLRQRGLYGSLQRSQPTAANGIRVEFENVAFDDLMLWLGDLSGNYGMQVQSGTFSGTSGETSGRVNSSLTLER